MSSETFTVSGMTCDHCKNAVTAGLSRLRGVSRVDVDLTTGRVTVDSDDPLDRGEVGAAVDEAGYELAS